MRMRAVLLTMLYLTALAGALRDPSEHLVAGAVVLLAVLWRLPATRLLLSSAGTALRERRARPEEAVAPAVVPATPG